MQTKQLTTFKLHTTKLVCRMSSLSAKLTSTSGKC